MCGIYGYLHRAHRQDRAMPDDQLHAMGQTLAHRGPDGAGQWHSQAHAIAVGNMRLSIIDVVGGGQPFVSADGQIALVQNGEIFNYVELAAELRQHGVHLDTQSDTEVLLRLYEREGLGFLNKLNGMFAIAIADLRDNSLTLVRDRIGVKPLYLYDDGEQVQFASEIKAFKASSSRLTLDVQALHHYLSFNYIPAPWTIWQQVRHVMPGTWVKYSAQGVQTQRWWSLADQQEQAMEESVWARTFLDLLEDATRLRLRSDVPVGAFLSGGVDSSSVVAMMRKNMTQPIKTFAIGFDDARFDESRFAATAAQRWGCDLHTTVISPDVLTRWPQVLHHLDQPHGDASFLPTLCLSEAAARDVKVVLTGDGGDELFAGYDKYANFFAPGLPSGSAWHRAYFDSISLFSPAEKNALYQPHIAHAVQGLDSFEAAAQPWLAQASHFGPVNQALYLDMQLLLSGNNLVKPDRMGMAASLEARTPFLDYRLMEFAFRSRGDTKLHGGEKKHWFKRAAAPLIGADLAYRPKQMLTVPVGVWFEGEKLTWLNDLLSQSAFLQGVFQMPVIENLLAQHASGQANHTRQLRALAALALWAQGEGLR